MTCSICNPPLHSTGGPGSGKGRLVANLRSMFGMKLVSVESVILKYLPKKVAHSMTLNSVEVSSTLCMTAAVWLSPHYC